MQVQIRLEDESGQQRFTFRPGETVTITVTATNQTDETFPVEPRFADMEPFRVRILSKDFERLIYNATPRAPYGVAITNRELPPGIISTKKYTWTIGERELGNYIAAARYTLNMADFGYAYAARTITVQKPGWPPYPPPVGKEE